MQLPDKSDVNEIQSLSLQSGLLTITGANSVLLPDASDKNEIQTLSLQTGTLSLSNGGGSVSLPDTSATNEIQSLSLQDGQLSISSSNSVTLPDADATNEIQSLSLQNGALQLSKDSATVDVKNLKTFLGFSIRVPVGTSKGVGWSILPFSEIVWNTFPASSFNTVTRKVYLP